MKFWSLASLYFNSNDEISLFLLTKNKIKSSETTWDILIKMI